MDDPSGVGVPGGIETLKAKEALENFRDKFFANEMKPWALDSFNKEVAKSLGLHHKDVSFPQLEHAFIHDYADNYFDGDAKLMKSVIQFAYDEAMLSVVSWLSIKDSVSPALATNKLFDGLLSRAQGNIGYNKYFGGLGSLTSDKDRTIFSPAAYFTDLLRMMHMYFVPAFMDDLKKKRRPDLFTLPLSPSNTRDTLPLINIINESLEMILLSEWNKRLTDEEKRIAGPFSIDKILAEAKFPFNLPHHKGLTSIRANLSLEKGPDISYAELIHQVQENFIAHHDNKGDIKKHTYHKDDRRVEELLNLSPEEAKYIKHSSRTKEEIASFYGFDRNEKTSQVLKELGEVVNFTARTGLSRAELKLMIERNLSDDQLAAGESRKFFINDVQDGKQPLFMMTKTKLENVVIELNLDLGDEVLPKLKLEAKDHLNFGMSDNVIVDRFVSLKLFISGKNGKENIEVSGKIGYSTAAVTVATLKDYIYKHVFAEEKKVKKIDVKIRGDHPDRTRSSNFSDDTKMSEVVDYWLTKMTSLGDNKPEQNDYAELSDTVENLSWEKLDRIHRFIRLWRKADMNFKELDWMIATQQQSPSYERKEGVGDSVMAYCPYFDGIDDVISINLPKTVILPWTIEFWVKPMVINRMKIMEVKDSWVIGLNDDGKLVCGAEKLRIPAGTYALPLRKFSHVALTIHDAGENGKVQYVLTGFMNGRKDFSSEIKKDLTIGGDMMIGQGFKGCFQELRIWDGKRDIEKIRSTMNTRLVQNTKESLIHYWPLNTSYGGKVWDALGSVSTHGNLGNGIHAHCPRWIVSDAPVDASDVPGMHFSGDVQLLSGNSLPIHDTTHGFFIEVLLTLTDIDTEEDGVIFLDEKDGKLSNSIKLSISGSKARFSVNGIIDETFDLEVEIMYHLRATFSKKGILVKKAVLLDVEEESSSLSFVRVSNTILDSESKSTNSDMTEGSLTIGKGFHGVVHRLKVGTLPPDYLNDKPKDLVADLADWTMRNVATETSKKIIVEDASGNNRNIEGGQLLRNQRINLKTYEGIGSQVVCAMDGKSVIELSNENNVGLARFPPITFGIWFSPGETYNSKQVVLAQGDDDVGLLCYVWRNKLRVTCWTHHSGSNKSGSILIADRDLDSNISWHHLGVALERIPTLSKGKWKVGVTLNSNTILDGKIISAKLSPTEPIYLGGIRDIDGRQVVIDSDGKNTLIQKEQIPSLNFRGKLADFRMWNGFLSSQEIQEARAVSSVYQKVAGGPKMLLVLPLDRESVDVREIEDRSKFVLPDTSTSTTAHTSNDGMFFSAEEETENNDIVLQNGVILVLREDAASFAKRGLLSQFKATLYQKKAVLSTKSEASTFVFSRQTLDFLGSFKVTGRMRLTNPKGRVAIIVGGLALTWDAKMARFRITQSDNLSGWSGTGANIFKDTSIDEKLKAGMNDKRPRWFQFAIQVENNNGSNSTSGKTIRACVWYQGEVEPELRPVDFEFSLLPPEEQPAMRTVGVWTFGNGMKQVDDMVVKKLNSTTTLLLAEGFDKGPEEFDRNWGVWQYMVNSENVLNVRPNDENKLFDGILHDTSNTFLRFVQPDKEIWRTTFQVSSQYKISGLMWIPKGSKKNMGVAFYVGQSPILVGAQNGDIKRNSLSFYTFGWSGSRQKFELIRNSAVLGFHRTTLAQSVAVGEVSGWLKFEVTVKGGSIKPTQLDVNMWAFSHNKNYKLSANDKGLDRLASGGIGFYTTDERVRFWDVNVLSDRDSKDWKGPRGKKFEEMFPAKSTAPNHVIASATDQLLFGYNKEGNDGNSMRLEGEFRVKDDMGSVGFISTVGDMPSVGIEIGTSNGKRAREITGIYKNPNAERFYLRHNRIAEKIEIKAGRFYTFVADLVPCSFVTSFDYEGNLVTQYVNEKLSFPEFWRSGGKLGDRRRPQLDAHQVHHGNMHYVSRLVVDRRTVKPRLVIFRSSTQKRFGEEVWSEEIKMPSPPLPTSQDYDVLFTNRGGQLGVGQTIMSVSKSNESSDEAIKFLLRQTNSGKLILKIPNSGDILWESSEQGSNSDNDLENNGNFSISALNIKVWPSSDTENPHLLNETYQLLLRHDASSLESRKFGILSNGAIGNEFQNLRCRANFRLFDDGDKGAIDWERSDIKFSREASKATQLILTYNDWKQALMSDSSRGRITNDNAVGFDLESGKYLVAYPNDPVIDLVNVDREINPNDQGWTWQAKVHADSLDNILTLLTLKTDLRTEGGEREKVSLEVSKGTNLDNHDSLVISFKGRASVEVEGSLDNVLVTVVSHLSCDKSYETLSVFVNGLDVDLKLNAGMTSTLCIGEESMGVSGSIKDMILLYSPLPEGDIKEFESFAFNEIISKYANRHKSLLGGDLFTAAGSAEEEYQLWSILPLIDLNAFQIGGTENKFHPSPVVERLPESLTPVISAWKRSNPVISFPQKALAIDSTFVAKAERQRTIEMWFMANDVNKPGTQMLLTGDGPKGIGKELSSFGFAIEGGHIRFGTAIRARISSGHWYHIAMVLKGSREERLDAYTAYLNGLLVGAAPGKMSVPPDKLYFGSDSFDGKIIPLEASNFARSATVIEKSSRKPNFTGSIEMRGATWLGRDKVLSTSANKLASMGDIDSETLQRVATVRWLDDMGKIPVSDGIYLFAPLSPDDLKRVFNNGVLVEERWDPLELSIPWQPDEKTIASYSVRLQLAVSLKVSSQGLDNILVALGVDLDQRLTVDGPFLNRLLRFSRFVNLFGIGEMVLIDLLQVTTGSPTLPENASDLMYLARILEWLFEERGVPPQSLSDFFEESISDSLVVDYAIFVTEGINVPSYTLSATSFVDGKSIDEEISTSIYNGISSSFLDSNSDTSSTVVSSIRGFDAEDLRNDLDWRTIFRPRESAVEGLLDIFAENDLNQKLKHKKDVMKALTEDGFLFGPKMDSKKLFDFVSLASMSTENEASRDTVWERLNKEPNQKNMWEVFLPKWVRKWAGIKEHVESVLLEHRRALDNAFSEGFIEVFGEDPDIAKTINLDTYYEKPSSVACEKKETKRSSLVIELATILTQGTSFIDLKARIKRVRNEAGTLTSINALAKSVTAQMESFTITADSFVSTIIDEKLSTAVFAAMNPDDNSPTGLFLDGRTRTVAPRFRGISADAIRYEKDWQMLFRPDTAMPERFYGDNEPNPVEGMLDEFARRDLALDVKKSSKVPTSSQPGLVEEVMNLLVDTENGLIIGNEDGTLFGPGMSSTQFFDVSRIRDAVNPDYSAFKQFWNILLPKWLRKCAKIKEHIEAVFIDFRRVLDDSFSVGIADVFELDDESAAAINLDTNEEKPLFEELKRIALENKEASTDLKERITKISNAANLANAVGLDLSELTMLWKMPEAFEVKDLSRISFHNLITMAKYTEIRDLLLELREENEVGVGVGTDTITNLANWQTSLNEYSTQALKSIGLNESEIKELLEKGGGDFNLSKFWKASRIVKLMRRTGAPMTLVLALGKIEGPGNNSHQQWNSLASSLAETVSYVTGNGNKLKDKVFQETQVPLRDAMLDRVSHRYRNSLENITTVDASLTISNFLLFDVLTGPKVIVSRIQQAIASIQFLIQRCLMGLEDNTKTGGGILIPSPFKSADGKDDVLDHWERWMKNYRVWEATRKVFLYPENFLEPDLRKNKTPLFESFESSAGDGSDPENAITTYIKNFQALTSMTIVGSTYKATVDSDGKEKAQKLALVGKYEGEIFIRERIQVGTAPLWEPWQKLDNAIGANFVSPVYAFGELHLYWMKEDKSMEQMYAISDKKASEFRTSMRISMPQKVKISIEEEVRKTLPIEYQFPAFMIQSFEFTTQALDISDIFNHSESLTATRNKDYRMVSKKEIDNFLKEQVDIVINNNLLSTFESQATRQFKSRRQSRSTILSFFPEDSWNLYWNKVYKTFRDFISDPKYGQKFFLLSMRPYVREVKKVLTEFFQGRTSKGADDNKNTDCPTIFGELIKFNIQYQTRSSDGSWSMPQDIMLNERVYFFSESNLPDGERCEAKHLQPEQQILRLISGRKDLLKAPLSEVIQEQVLSVFDVTFSRVEGLVMVTEKPVGEATSLLWETLVQIDRIFEDKFSTITDSDLQYEPQHIKAYDMKVGDMTVSLSLKQHEIKVDSKDWITTSNLIDAGRVLDFLKGSEPLSFDRVVEVLGVVKPGLLQDKVKEAFELLQKDGETDELYNERLGIEKKREEENAAEYKERRSITILNKKEMAVNAITPDSLKSQRASLLKEQVYTFQRGVIDIILSVQESTGRILEDKEPINLNTAEMAKWEPIKMELTNGKVKVTMPGSFDRPLELNIPGILLSSAVELKPILGSHIINDPATASSPTFQLLMSESRIWKSKLVENPFENVEFSKKKPFRRRVDTTLLVGKSSLTETLNAEDEGIIFVNPSVPLYIEKELTVPDLRSEKIYVWRKEGSVDEPDKSIIEIDQAGEDRRRDRDWLAARTKDKYQYSSLHLVQDSDAVSANFGKIAITKTTETDELSKALEYNLVSGGSKRLGFVNDDVRSTKSTGKILLDSETDSSTETERIDFTKSFLLPVGNTLEGCILDTSDERFLIIPSEPRTILRSNTKQQAAFECTRLGSTRTSEILLKNSTGIKSLYTPRTQLIRESKIGLQTTDMNDEIYLPDMDSPIDFNGPNGIYYREVFFEIPLHLATTLNSAGDYQSAQKWMHYVYNPQKENAWIYRPFNDLLRRGPAIASITNSAALGVLQRDMLDPHAIADTRMVAHMKAFMFRYIDNLLDWGDSLFSQDTREAINESLILYLRCQAILGERPYSIPGSGEFELKIQTAHDVFPPNYEDTFARRFFLPGWKNRPVVRKYANQSNYSEISDVLESPAVLGQFFEVPENKQLMTYWDRLDDRLDKIRRSLNISGIFRQLPLFQPPIDPRALIAAGGASGAMVAQPIPHYRYSFLLENAKEMVEMCSSLGAQFQAAMETKSAE